MHNSGKGESYGLKMRDNRVQGYERDGRGRERLNPGGYRLSLVAAWVRAVGAGGGVCSGIGVGAQSAQEKGAGWWARWLGAAVVAAAYSVVTVVGFASRDWTHISRKQGG